MNRKEELQAELKQRAAKYARVFGTEEGQAVLKDLVGQFNHENLADADTHQGYRKIGEFNVIRRIQTMLEINNAVKKQEA